MNSRNVTIKLFFIVLFFTALCWQLVHFPAAHAADQRPATNALLIYGSGGIANWDQGFNESLRNELGPDLGQYFTPEFLSLVSAEPGDLELIANSLALKYSNKDIGLVIAVLPEANSFVNEWMHVFAPGAASLRVLPGQDTLQQASNLQKTVILDSAIGTAIAGTTDLMPSLFPNLERIYLVGGAGVGDLAYMERYKAGLSTQNLPYEFRYLSGLPLTELVEELSAAPANSAVMTTTYDIDNAGRPLRSIMATELLAESLTMPVFGLSDPQIPVGAIGGNVTTVDAYARTAMRLIMGILEGRYPEQPVTADTDYLFNGAQLERFNINRNLLPANSIIINDVPNLWRDYSQWILLGITIIAIQALLITALLEARRRRQLAEAQLARAHKMEALGTLAGGIAHDFNNILMSIMANTELISFQAENDSETQDRLGKILSASDRAKNLITQILLFSRQSGSTEQETLDLRLLIEESIDQIRAFLPATCKVTITGEKNLPTINGDAVQLYQVIMNISVNAQQAMKGIGEIKIRIDNAHVEQAIPVLGQEVPAGDYVALSITDSGSGIDEQNLKHIFEPFYTTKSHGEGTGLGLSLVYQIIKSHKGYINIKSKPGCGTSVTVYFPAGGNEVASSSHKEPARILQGNNEHILLVDDDELVLDANQQILVKLGYAVTSFSNSVAALREFEQHPEKFDLVFSDLSMPEMDGVRLTSNMRLVKSDIPVVLCTGYLDALNPAELEDIHILRKPSSASDISQAVKTELQNQKSA